MRSSPSPAWLVVLILAAASGLLYVQHRRAAGSLAAAVARERSIHDQYTRAIDDIATIQDSLNAIVPRSAETALRSGRVTAERRLSPARGDEALARIRELRAGIERARRRIEQLESNLKSGGAKAVGLERLVARLREGLTDKERLAARLTRQVDSLRTHVTGLNATVAQRETTIAAQATALEASRSELGTVYCLIGSRRDLLKSGVVVARGGVLGLGRTLGASGRLDEREFEPVDTDRVHSIAIRAARARVLTPQPVSSYRLVLTNGRLELVILDAHEFRKVRHLVIVTA